MCFRYVSMSLSPRPDTVSTAMSSGRKFRWSSAPSAWADSNAGIIPSVRVSVRGGFHCFIIVFFIRSGEKTQGSGEKKVKSREKIISLLLQDGSLSAASLAGHIGITAKAVEKQLARLKAEGLIRRVGPDKGGYWQVLKEP